jgi:hypothetical protein
VIQGKLLSPNDFTDLAELERRLHAIQHRYQQTTVPSTAASPRRPRPAAPPVSTSTSTAPLRHDHHT